MEIRLQQLKGCLTKSFPATTLLSGDDSILMQETSSSIREFAHKHGYEQRQSYHTEEQFNWQQLPDLLMQQDLFSNKTLIEINNPKASFDKKTTEIMLRCCRQMPAHKRLVIYSSKLSSSQVKTKWYKTFCQLATSVRIWPLQDQQIMPWLKQQLLKHKLELSQPCQQLIVQLSQNNLLDMMQVVEKLSLQDKTSAITPQLIQQLFTCHLACDVFTLTQAILNRNLAEVIHHSQQIALQDSKQLILLVWALIQMLQRLQKQLMGEKVFAPTRLIQQATQQAAKRYRLHQIQHYLHRVGQIELQLKGCSLTHAQQLPGLQILWDRLYQLMLDILFAKTSVTSL